MIANAVLIRFRGGLNEDRGPDPLFFGGGGHYLGNHCMKHDTCDPFLESQWSYPLMKISGYAPEVIYFFVIRSVYKRNHQFVQ